MLPKSRKWHAKTISVGDRFGKLTAVRFSHANNGNYWECSCECGSVVVRRAGDLLRQARDGAEQSCVCAKRRTFDDVNYRCGRCGMVKHRSEFTPDKRNSSGLHGHCKSCQKNWRSENADLLKALALRHHLANPDYNYQRAKSYRARNRAKYAMRESIRRAKIRLATPAWADHRAIADIYLEAEYFQMQVDHIVPLVSDLVCGLHVEHNLQLLSKSENSKKSNRRWPDMPGRSGK